VTVSNDDLVVSGAAGADVSTSVTLEDVGKRFGSVSILDHLNLKVEDRELLVLLGPSGCGKTTTLNVIAGLEPVDSGRVLYGTDDVTRVPPENRDVSMVFQTVGLYPHLNVYENITFPLKLKKIPSAVITKRVSAMVELLGIGHVVKRRIHEISGGERQRVAFAKALVKRPRLFLLDEPFSSLDAEIRRQLRTELVRIHRELHTTMVFITHDQEEAMSIGDRVGVMNRGQLLQFGSPLQVYQWPSSLWVARFIGTHPINVLEVQIVDGQVVVEGDRPLVLGTAPENLKGAPTRAQLALGVRPESLTLSAAEEAASGPLYGQVVIRHVMGNIILYDVELPNGSRLRVLTPSTLDYAIDSRVFIGIQWNSARVFDRDTGMLLLGPEPTVSHPPV